MGALINKTMWVIMVETGEAEEWKQLPVAVFEDKDEAKDKMYKWNAAAREFQKIFMEELPYVGFDIYWIKDMKFSLHEVALPKISRGKSAP